MPWNLYILTWRPSAPLRDRHFILEKIDETPIKQFLLIDYTIYGRWL